MKKLNKIVITIFLFNVVVLLIAIKFSYALNNDITSSTYEIKDNKIYAVPTTYNYRVEELLSNIESTSEIKVYDSNNEELKNGDYISNGSKVIANNTTYEIILLGDITGDGKIQLSDISLLYNVYKSKQTLNDERIESGKLTGNTKLSLGDVAKLYNYYRGKSAFTSYDFNMIDVDNIVEKANSYYRSNTSNKLGTNLINELNVNHNDNDQVVITREGKVELAINKDNKCYRKSALSNFIDVVDDYYCEADITKFASNNGRLHVSGSKLLNEYNEEIRLTGVSNSEPPKNSEAIREQGTEMYSEDSLHTLHTWGGNVFRIFMSIKYINWTGEQHDKLMNDLKDSMDAMISNDMYIILNWSRGSLSNKDYAKAFFEEISALYPNDIHVIYEIWNEPNDVTWEEVKEYANYVIPSIRETSPDSIILVGSPKWDSRLDYVAASPLNVDNIMYTHHTYMNQFTGEHLSYLNQAINAGLPIFETECSSVKTGVPVGSYINDAQAYSFFKMLEEKNISFTYFSWDSGMWAYNIVAYKEHAWDENLPDSIMRESGKYIKKLLRGKIETESYLMKENSDLSNGLDYRSNEYRTKILSVSFKKENTIPSNAVTSWDLSFNQDGTIKGYLTEASEENMYDLTIISNGYINLPTNASSLFKGLTNVKSYDFENARTDLVIRMAYMFAGNSSLEVLNLSSFDTKELSDIGFMFSGCSSLRTINLDNWSPKLYDFVSVFYNCSSLEELDLHNFDVTKAKNFSGAFYNNSNLRTLNLTNWNTGIITSLRNTFANMSSIENLDLSGFNQFSSTCDYEKVLYGINSNVVITTGNEEFKTLMMETYPSLNIN